MNVRSILALAALLTATGARAGLTAADCAKITPFPAKHSGRQLSKAECRSARFYANGTKADNPKKPICLGFSFHVDKYLTSHPGGCERLAVPDAVYGKGDLNFQFMECILSAAIGNGNVVWTTDPAFVGVDAALWSKVKSKATPATVSEMCLWERKRGMPKGLYKK
jgi:hypothetical protein